MAYLPPARLTKRKRIQLGEAPAVTVWHRRYRHRLEVTGLAILQVVEKILPVL